MENISVCRSFYWRRAHDLHHPLINHQSSCSSDIQAWKIRFTQIFLLVFFLFFLLEWWRKWLLSNKRLTNAGSLGRSQSLGLGTVWEEKQLLNMWRLKSLSETRKVELLSYADEVQVEEKQGFMQNDGSSMKNEGRRNNVSPHIQVYSHNVTAVSSKCKCGSQICACSPFNNSLMEEGAFPLIIRISNVQQIPWFVILIHSVSSWNWADLSCPGASWFVHLHYKYPTVDIYVSFNWTHASAMLVVVARLLVSHGN